MVKKRNRQIHVMFNDEEYAQLAYKAKVTGMSFSAVIRELLFHGSMERYTNYSCEDTKLLLSELCDISNAMSEIAYTARIKNCIDEGEYLQLESNFKSLLRAFGEHVTGI